MEILASNIQEEEFSMELLFKLFESEERESLSNHKEETIDINHYAIYTDENAKGEIVKLMVIESVDGTVCVTSSASFIRAFERMHCLAERCGEYVHSIKVKDGVSQKNRHFLTAEYIK